MRGRAARQGAQFESRFPRRRGRLSAFEGSSRREASDFCRLLVRMSGLGGLRLRFALAPARRARPGGADPGYGRIRSGDQPFLESFPRISVTVVSAPDFDGRREIGERLLPAAPLHPLDVTRLTAAFDVAHQSSDLHNDAPLLSSALCEGFSCMSQRPTGGLNADELEAVAFGKAKQSAEPLP